ncbi:MAG: NTPase [Candidatus Verstraetearchaeota archaeon]|jgi:nucleoside-triphosphatase|nr:NTPase [Candidatus Verstraetearchaeota archaeon]
MKKAFITGRPGVGKSTVLREVITILKNKGWKIGGIFCPEIRKDGRRIGFNIVDIFSNTSGILASINLHNGPRIGRYYVNINDIERIAIPAIKKSLEEADLTVIDEIGPMELLSHKFHDLVMEILLANKSLLCVVHKSLIKEFSLKFPTIPIFEVTEENRSFIASKIVDYFLR